MKSLIASKQLFPLFPSCDGERLRAPKTFFFLIFDFFVTFTSCTPIPLISPSLYIYLLSLQASPKRK